MKRKLFFILSLFLISSIYIFGENFPQDEAIRNRVMGVPSNWKSILNDIISS